MDQSSSILDIADLQENPESLYVHVKKDYLLAQHQTIKELHRILKIRLRVDTPDEARDLKQILQQKLDLVIGNYEKLEWLIKLMSRQNEENQENKILAQKYKELLSVFNQANESYRNKNEELVSKISKLRKEVEEHSFKNQSLQLENERLSQTVKESTKKLEDERKLSESHENLRKKWDAEKEALKNQNLQINNLLKKQQESFTAKSSQRLEEKDKILEKISFLNDEFEKAKENLNQKIMERDLVIGKLERKCKMLENEKELFEDIKAMEKHGSSTKTLTKLEKSSSNEKKKKKKKKPGLSANSPEKLKTPEKNV